jgi:hypothetical protein
MQKQNTLCNHLAAQGILLFASNLFIDDQIHTDNSYFSEFPQRIQSGRQSADSYSQCSFQALLPGVPDTGFRPYWN